MTAIISATNVDAAGYAVTYQAPSDSSFVTVGTVEAGEDFQLSIIKRMQEFTASQFGDTPVEGIYTGKACLLTMVLNEINRPAALGLTDPESQQGGDPSTGGIPGELGTVGAVASSLCGTLRLTPYFTSLPAFGLGAESANRTIEIPHFWVEDGHELRRQLSAGRHTVPLSIRVFPFIDEDDEDTPKLFRFVA